MKKILVVLIAALFIIILYAIAYYSSVDNYEFETRVLTMGIVGIAYTCTHIAFVIVRETFNNGYVYERDSYSYY